MSFAMASGSRTAAETYTKTRTWRHPRRTTIKFKPSIWPGTPRSPHRLCPYRRCTPYRRLRRPTSRDALCHTGHQLKLVCFAGPHGHVQLSSLSRTFTIQSGPGGDSTRHHAYVQGLYLTGSTAYYYGIEATEASYVSAMSAIVSAITLPLPNMPTNLTASAISGSKVGLSWRETVPPQGLAISGYQIYCGVAPGSLSKVGSSASLSYTYANLTASTTYYRAVQATDTGGNISPMSAAVSAATDGLPNAPPTWPLRRTPAPELRSAGRRRCNPVDCRSRAIRYSAARHRAT